MQEMGFGEEEDGAEGETGDAGEGLTATLQAPSELNRKYKAGDAALRLDVIHLNAFQAMEAAVT